MIAAAPVDSVFLIGENFSEVPMVNNKVKFFEKFEEFAEQFVSLEFENTTFLIKASRGMALERVMEFL